jgi:hypothetical protein
MLRNWNGELRLLQNFKLKRFSRKSLQQQISYSKNNEEELVVDGDITVSVKAPAVQIIESDSQSDGKSDFNETAACLEKKEQEIMDDSMDVSNR